MGRDTLSQDDAYIWQLVTAEVTPLHGSANASDSGEPLSMEDALAAPRPVTAKHAATLQAGVVRPSLELAQTANPSASKPEGFEPRWLDQLRAGSVPMDRRIDLHGMAQHAAFLRLGEVIDTMLRRRQRHLLVVTGKGSGALQQNVPRWIQSQPRWQGKLVGLAAADTKHGGDGALYVKLRAR